VSVNEEDLTTGTAKNKCYVKHFK